MMATQKAAKAAGEKKYFTGRPCEHGEIAPRWTANGHCSCAAHEADRKAKMRAKYASDGGRKLALVKAWQASNPDKVRACREASRDIHNDASKRWAAANPARVLARNAKRRASRRQAVPGWYGELDELVVREAADLARRREACTGFAWHVDHMIPLQARDACGLHVAANIQVIPAAMNIAKGNRMVLTQPGQWLSNAGSGMPDAMGDAP